MKPFDRFKKKETDFEIACKKMAADFIGLYMKETNTPFENITELERQILVIYFFGMADGLRQESSIDSSFEKVEKNITTILNDVFNYSEKQTKAFLDSIIDNLQTKDPQNTQYAIVHRGLDGYYVWNIDSKTAVIEDVLQIYGILKR